METTKFIWMNGKFVRWNRAKVHILTHALHYGSGVFEGIRFYDTPDGPAIFRLDEHVDRLIYSAKSITLPLQFNKKEIRQAIIDTVKKNKVRSGYIRPLAWFGEGKMGLKPHGAKPNLMIACWPWGKYLGKEVVHGSVSKYIRIHPKSVISDAKVTGYYINSIFATLDAESRKADEAILLDFEGFVAEGPGENIFAVKKGKVYTPKKGSILPGITRSTIKVICDNEGIEFIEQEMKPSFIKKADEAFFTGTAAEVTGLGKLDETKIANGKLGPITRQIRDIYLDAVSGKIEKYKKFLTYV